MPIKIKSNLDYQQFCDEIGITLEDLQFLQSMNMKNISLHADLTFAPLITDVLIEYKEHILELNKRNKRADSTIKTYTNFLFRLNKFIVAKDSTLTILKLNEDLLMEMLDNSKPRKNERISINTYNKYQSILRKLVFYCYDKGYINKDLSYRFPIQNIDSLPRYLTLEQLMECFNKALQKSYGYRCRAMLVFLAGTGCRVSELVNIRVCDFNIKEKLIYIYNGKGRKDRTIPIFNEVEKVVLHYLKLSGLTEWDPSCTGYLFCRDEGEKREVEISVDSVQYLVRNIFKAMNLNKDFTVHSFRHTFAVNCLKSGISLHYITQMLGHTDPKTTQIYLKLQPMDLKEEVMKNYPLPFENLLQKLI